MSAASPYRALIPPNQPVGIEVSAPGYETWQHLGGGNQPEATPLQLKSGEPVTIAIQLRPAKQPKE
jgi:hypothetical protein